MDIQYDSMTLVKLREYAKEKGMKNIASLKKAELIQALKEYDLSNQNNSNVEETVSEAAPVIREDNKRSGHSEIEQLDSGETKVGIPRYCRMDMVLFGATIIFRVKMMYVSPAQIRRFNLKTGDIVAGNTRIKSQNEKFSALLYIKEVNGFHPAKLKDVQIRGFDTYFSQ